MDAGAELGQVEDKPGETMSPDIMNEALRATARIACCAALIGCNPTISEPYVELSPADEYTDTDTAADPLEACRDAVAETFAEDLTPTAETEDCCQLIAEEYDARELEGLELWNERNACCQLLGWNGSMACTPWGPPVPPTMPQLLQAA